jgi:predicted Mrr-cat superfamily restriction endonuclease
MSERRAWCIKLGSGGRCVPFCESHKIVGLGWKWVDPKIVAAGSREQLWNHIHEANFYKGDRRKIGGAAGQMYRFGQECAAGDYVFYYDPPRKHVRICRVISGPLYRNFDENQDIDIWHYRKVEYSVEPIPVLDFHGVLKGTLLGPRMSFWSMPGGTAVAESLISGVAPTSQFDKEYDETCKRLRDLLVKRSEALNHADWECLVADFLRSRGADLGQQRIGGNRPIIDVEAQFDHGEFGQETWRVQVKCLRDRKVDWPEIEQDFKNVGEARFCYVSVFGFTELARENAEANDIVLLEAGDFAEFLISGKLRQGLRQKLRLTADWDK